MLSRLDTLRDLDNTFGADNRMEHWSTMKR